MAAIAERRAHLRQAAPPAAARPRAKVLHPGDVAVGTQGDRLETLLGSCVAVLLTDPARTVGAMCHIVHSGTPRSGATGTAHAGPAFDAMFALLRARGVEPTRCEAYLVGGGNMFPGLLRDVHIGDANTQWALARLEQLNIPIVAHDIGGTTYRRVAWTIGEQQPQVEAVEV